MKIKDYHSFVNEEFLGIDLKKIKQAAFEFSKSKEFKHELSKIDPKLLDSVSNEIQSLKDKWGSIDNLSKKLITKAENKNEGLASTIILTTFGIHAIWKLLVALKGGWSFWHYIGRLFYSSTYDFEEIRTIRDVIISVTFCIYAIVYTVQSTTYTRDTYKTATGAAVDIPSKWDGLNNYTIKDSYDKVYNCKKIESGKFDLFYKGKKIGYTINDTIYNLSNKMVLDYNTHDLHDNNGNWLPGTRLAKVDLERALTGKYNPKSKTEIDLRKSEIENIKKRIELDQKSIDKLDTQIDSLDIKAYENVDVARKVFKENNLDYDVMTDKSSIGKAGERLSEDYEKITFNTIKDELEKNNNLGYLGLFTKLFFDRRRKLGRIGSSSSYEVIHQLLAIYKKIIKNKDILNNLRDNNGVLKNIMLFDRYEDLDDALSRLEQWKHINLFMRELPSTQKNLLWKDGWFRDELKSKSQFLTKSILRVKNDESMLKQFLRKVSAIKTQDSFVDILSDITNEQPWDFDYWLKKLNNTRNVYVTWSSKEENQIICAVASYPPMKKIAYMTSWCIYRGRGYFNDYSAKGLQCILYDFNLPASRDESVIGFTVDNKLNLLYCHDKSDYSSRLPSKFTDRERGYNGSVKPEYLKINLAKAALKFDNTILKLLRNKLSQTLNRPGISKFIDFYDED